MNAGTVTFKERELMGHATVTIRVLRSPTHRIRHWLGLRIARCGLLISGVGTVEIEEWSQK